MRNIKLVQKRQKSIGPAKTGCQLGQALYTIGSHGCVYICGDGVLSKFSFDDDDQVVTICENSSLLGDATQIQYVASTGVIYLGNKTGSLCQVAHFETGHAEVEELFQSEQGIACFSVSPDSRFVAIVTKQHTVLLLTLPDLETVNYLSLGDAFEEANSAKIVWREDSHFFAVNSKHNDKFQISIFDESGALESKTEDTVIDSVLEWQPSGNLIAGVGKTPHGTVVSLFEKNGLKRADFFPYEGKNESYESDKLEDISWNASSDVLALVYGKKVELWTRNNYVWMRKLTLIGSCGSDSGLVYTTWDREHNNRLHRIDKSGAYTIYDVAFTYTSGHSNGLSLVTSLNGNSFYSTPLRNNCCPPPYCQFQCSCESEIVAAVVPPFWNGVLTVTSNGEFSFWMCDENELKLVKIVTVAEFQQFSDSCCFTWPTRNKICCVSNSRLVLFDLVGEFDQHGAEVKLSLNCNQSTSIKHQEVISAFVNTKTKDDPRILLQTRSGLVLQYDLELKTCRNLSTFSQICTELQLISDNYVIGGDPLTRKLMIGWSECPDCEPVVISSDFTSFTVYQNSLIYTTIQGSLEIRNQSFVAKLVGKEMLGNGFSNEEQLFGRYSRKCEKGSVIVSCCLNQMLEPSLVLQIIPRGNLETIYPRPLVIDTVKVILRDTENDLRYERIMTALRRHRIDYRLLIDEMKVLVKEVPDCRLEELLKAMVEQVKDSHGLVLLVTDLNEDYTDCIRTIKTLLEGVLSSSSETRMVHIEESYLAALAKLGSLEEALKSSLIQGENENNRQLVQQRVKFLSFYCENPDILFDTALGTYDLSLASLVADCLGKDPKEFIPVLDGFQSMLELKRRFKIDDKLKRFSKAVISLIRDQRAQHSEIVKYMERHRLFSDVVEFLTRKLKYDEGGVVERSRDDMGLLLREAQSSYAKYLEERGKMLEAGILLREAQNIDRAIQCCIKSGNWEFALEIAFENNIEKENLKSIFGEILATLEDKKLYGDAARLCETYLCDVQQAVYFWIKDKNWQHASTLCMKSPGLGVTFREEIMKPKLLDCCTELKETMHQVLVDVDVKLQRLRIVKEKKAQRIAETGGMGDNFSDTESYLSGSSTSGSLSSSNVSGKSYRSGKNKRKLERKVYSLKEGSKHEDLAIVAHVWTVIDKIDREIKPEATSTAEHLWRCNQSEHALTLCEVLENMLQEADKAVLEVWNVPLTDEILEAKYRIPPINWTPVWNKLALQVPSSKAVIR